MPSEIAMYVPVLMIYCVVHFCWPQSSVYSVQISFFLLTNCYIEVRDILLLWTFGKVLYKQVCKPEYPGRTNCNVGNPYPHNYDSVLKITCYRIARYLWNKNYTTDVFFISNLTYRCSSSLLQRRLPLMPLSHPFVQATICVCIYLSAIAQISAVT